MLFINWWKSTEEILKKYKLKLNLNEIKEMSKDRYVKYVNDAIMMQ